MWYPGCTFIDLQNMFTNSCGVAFGKPSSAQTHQRNHVSRKPHFKPHAPIRFATKTALSLQTPIPNRAQSLRFATRHRRHITSLAPFSQRGGNIEV
jgi:hypothetical protein